MSVPLEMLEQDSCSEEVGSEGQFRNSLKAKTGFRSYRDYLRSLNEHCSILDDLDAPPSSLNPGHSRCFVMDLSTNTGPNVAMDVRLNLYFGPRPSTQFGSGRKLSEALHMPLPVDGVRVVQWSTPRRGSEPILTDALGLGLKIPFSFFKALQTRWSYVGRRQGTALPRLQDTSHLVIGNYVARLLAESAQPGYDGIPTVLLARVSQRRRPENLWEGDTFLENVAYDILKENQPGWQHVDEAYRMLLGNLLQQNRISDLSAFDIFVICLLPLLILDAASVRFHCANARKLLLEAYSSAQIMTPRDENQETFYSSLDMERFWFRRSIEDAEDSLERFRIYVQRNCQEKWVERDVYYKIKEDHHSAIREARRLETEIRDQMQLAVGYVAIDDSKRSIELSNIQIVEGKQGQSQRRSHVIDS